MTAEKCRAKRENGELCQEEILLEENIGKEPFGKTEPAIHHGEGDGYTHHSCRLGHAWHRNVHTGLMTPCDCTGGARGGV
ncbi:MAG TPA: hypothetical protein VLL57_04270 [Candidatus Binataceae bacterium]|nr:hypothetical protein [Candidatus Binataceae bacterium]